VSTVLTIPGEPIGQGRGRAVRTGAGVRIVDPEKSRNWKHYAQMHMSTAVIAPYTEALKVTIWAYWGCPKGEERKRTPRPEQYRAKIPDADNVMKAVFDAGNGVLWNDDRQIVDCRIMKIQAKQGEPARLVVKVEPIEV